MRTLIIYFFSVLGLFGHSQTIKLKYKPSGQIIKFISDSVVFYTDTNALFRANDDNIDQRVCRHVIRHHVKKELAKANNDTVTLVPNIISSLHDQFNHLTGENYVNSVISYLIKTNKIKILDKHGQIVKSIIIKYVHDLKTVNGNEIVYTNSFFNKQTKEEIYRQKMYCIGRCPGNHFLD